MEQTTKSFDEYVYSKHPDYDEKATRKEFAKAVPLRTVVVYCYDPRVVGIPEAVAKELGDVFPGDVVVDEHGSKTASTTTMFEIVVAGGRAIDALRSVTVAQHLFGIQNIVIVHHTNCGATTFTADGISDAFKQEHGNDISELYPRESISIASYQESLEHDARLVRSSAGTPTHVDIFGYVYDTDTGELSLVVHDEGRPAS